MNDEGIYKPVRLISLLRDIAPRFFLPGEFPARTPDGEVSEWLASAVSLTGRALEDFAAGLKSNALESLILYLPAADDRAKTAALRILALRANRRILELYWPFFQYHFEDVNVREGARVLLRQLPGKDHTAQDYINLALFSSENGFAALIDRLNADTVPLGLFMAREKLLTDSPLTARLTEQYFYGCKKEGFLLNEKRLLQTFEKTGPVQANKILTNYLSCLDRTEYLTDVNIYILNRWGEPATSAVWLDIPAALRRKFSDWIFYRRLSEHFSQNKLKLHVLNDYIPQIRHIALKHDGRYMTADFGEFVIVDDNELSSYSYLFKKSLYEQLADSLEKFSVEFVKLTKARVTAARDYIIDEAEDSFMQLEYDELGKLYIKDMLDIILNLVPDLRPSKSLVRKKLKKNSSAKERQ